MKNFLPLIAAAFGMGLMSAFATQTDNHGIHAVPAPGKVVIDGKLDDWDRSGEILMCYDLESLRDIYSGQVSMMYDAENLYVAIHWKDPKPLGNRHDPRFEANKGWAGDSVQLRIKTDRITHITAWYYEEGKEPAMQVSYGKSLTDPFDGGEKTLLHKEGVKLDEGVEMAFAPDADGKGYVQEIKLPWKLITNGGKFAAGDKFNVGIELLWGETDWPAHRYADNLAEGASSREFFWTAHQNWGPVFLEPKGNLKLPELPYVAAYKKAQQGDVLQGPVEISYDLPKDARVTLAIDDKDGNRVRNLIAALPRKAGKNIEKWDGLNDDGKPVEPGEYQFKVLYHDGIHASYVMSFANPGNPTWDTADGRGAFYGDHTAPQAAAAGGEFIALACPIGEGGRHLIGLNLEGQKLWGLHNREFGDGGRISLATDGKTLWVSNEGKRAIIYRVDIATGKYTPWEVKGGESILDLPVTSTPGVGSGNQAGLDLVAIAENQKAIEASGGAPEGVNLTAIAYHDGDLAVTLKRDNGLKILDGKTGESKAEFSVPAPTAVTFANGNWIVLSQGKLLRVESNGKTTPLSTESFPAGYGLATDSAGNIYLSVRGKDQNVKVFSPEGKLVREIGVKGGRPLNGVYDPNGMRNPSQIAIDSQDRLWVTEETMNPKRTSVWDAKTGALAKDLAGTATYSGAGAINPFDSTMAFSNDTVYQIDLEKGTSKPTYSLAKSSDANDLFPPRIHDYATSKVVSKDGKLFAYSGGSARGAADVQVTMGDGKNWRSVAHVGLVPKTQNPAELVQEWAVYKNPLFEGHSGELYAWVDQNGDGLVQANELSFSAPKMDGKPVDIQSFYWGQLPDDDGTLTFRVSGENALLRLPIASVNHVGAPVYDVANPVIVKADRPLIGGGNGEGMIIGGANGRVYINQDPLIAIEKDGHVLGGYPNHHTSVHGSHTAKAAKPGYLIGPSSFFGTANFGGEIGEVFYLNGNLGENYLFTQDGLWIQSLFKDTRGAFDVPTQAAKGMPMDGMTAGGESFGGNFILAKNGKTYLTAGGTDARVMEITGLDSIKRLSGKFSYTQKQYGEAEKLAQKKAAEANQPKVYEIAKSDVIALDGKPSEWPELLDASKSLLEIQESAEQRFGRVQLRYDSENLYVAWRVFVARSELKNSGQDYRLLFKSGDVVDLMIGPDPQKPEGAGNSRLLISSLGGKLVAVLNQKIAPDAAKFEGFDFASPWRTFHFDRVVQVPEVQIASGPMEGGYFVEAAIPWKVLGLQPKAGLKLKMDVGVLFGDAAGTLTIARHYWSNQATGLVNDVPGEADLNPELWGTLELK